MMDVDWSTYTLNAGNWVALVTISPVTQGYWHVVGRIRGEALVDAQEGAQAVLDHFGKGRSVFIRTEPEAEAYKDFDTDTLRYKGYVRFAFSHAPGDWLICDGSDYNWRTVMGHFSRELRAP